MPQIDRPKQVTCRYTMSETKQLIIRDLAENHGVDVNNAGDVVELIEEGPEGPGRSTIGFKAVGLDLGRMPVPPVLRDEGLPVLLDEDRLKMASEYLSRRMAYSANNIPNITRDTIEIYLGLKNLVDPRT